MKSSLTPGKLLPESEADFVTLVLLNKCALSCLACHLPFSKATVKSANGWKETQISHICESCFDKMFTEPLENEDE